MKQLDRVYHSEHGKGSIVAIKHRARTNLVMCYFPDGKETIYVTSESLLNDSHPQVSLQPRAVQEEQVTDDIQSALENLFFGGGQRPRE
jgi:hypothetical protein